MKQQCSELVHDDYGVGFHQCRNKVTHTFEGKPYCGRHNPGRDRTKEIERETKRKVKFDYDLAQRAMGWFGSSLYDALELLITEGDPSGIKASKKALREAKPYRELLKKGKPK